MARLFYFGALLGIVAVLSAPMCAQGVAPNRARVQHVVVRGTGATMEVEIQTSGAPVAPDTQTLAGPDRIVVDFPGALPAAELRALKVNRGALKGVRAGLFFDNPPITRIVLDLAEPQSYHISSTQNAVVIKLGSLVAGENASDVQAVPTAKLQNASLATGTHAAAAKVSPAAAVAPLPAAVSAAPQPALSVTFENGRLRIRADKATLAQVLFEVQRQTQAEIAIPAGAEQEQVVADLGPASARDVLAALLNGSAYNFVFVGTELTLQQVILTRRDSSTF